MRSRHIDTLVIGGGVVGMSVAYGFARAGDSVCVLDGSDDAFRASRGNFGLVWVQNKGLGRPAYARWTMLAARMWPSLAAELAELTGVDVELHQPGGLSMSFDEKTLTASSEKLNALAKDLGITYPYEVLDASGLRKLTPPIGPDVVGAIYCKLDGHVSPLRTLRALVHAFKARGGQLVSNVSVDKIEHKLGEFRVTVGAETFTSGRVVLAAGLGNGELAPQVGLAAPVRPIRGQILVTERVEPFLRYPCHFVRQTGEGTVQIGDSKEDVGMDDGTTLPELARIAARAVRCFPMLADVNLVRTWGALRVMSPDGYPIYDASTECPGAFVVTCHSGITLAPVHAGPLVDWMRTGIEPADLLDFKAKRFHVQAN
ncbi:Opine oxidase subunit B [Cupriavidus taiwanensis]|uniref:Opine oxidase subunit B n=1 Tax=Cupriavidus taiwanensis TaxID=164546 RepID=A0A375CRH9_9BURK|nr:FAD-dependent oxidoreductase [Cupriavidus taiwanensis]SOY77758.1 Opine oxidase subunit B [Cupriavidus taiwanensis]